MDARKQDELNALFDRINAECASRALKERRKLLQTSAEKLQEVCIVFCLVFEGRHNLALALFLPLLAWNVKVGPRAMLLFPLFFRSTRSAAVDGLRMRGRVD